MVDLLLYGELAPIQKDKLGPILDEALLIGLDRTRVDMKMIKEDSLYYFINGVRIPVVALNEGEPVGIYAIAPFDRKNNTSKNLKKEGFLENTLRGMITAAPEGHG